MSEPRRSASPARRVFLSHTSEFGQHPPDKSFVRTALEAVDRAQDAPCDMGYFAERDARSADDCREQVKSCEVYLGIIGLRYGSPVQDRPDVSYTELEFETAGEAGLQRFVFLLDPNALVPAARFTDPKHWDRQEAFRRRLQESGLTIRSFSTPEQLHALIHEALRESRAMEGGAAPPGEYGLKAWEKPPYPKEPYPLLLPYQHPDLFAGRERDLAELKRRLSRPFPILGLFSRSGVGKSSLLRAGLIPALREDGRPVAYCDNPLEPLLAAHLLDCMLEESAGHRNLGDENPELFTRYLRTAHRLCGKDPVLVLDQFEKVLHSTDARARVGVLLSSSVHWSSCRWVLCYRAEYHGRVSSWLEDVLRAARGTNPSRVQALPHDLTDRFHSWALKPFGSPPPGSDSIEESRAAFRSAIEAPLKITRQGDGGDDHPRYEISFGEGGVERLVEAFAQARKEQPDAPLVDELQVVLAHLMEEGETLQGRLRLSVPEQPADLIGDALRRHLERSLLRAYPPGAQGAGEGRDNAWLVLRELATSRGECNQGRPSGDLAAILGEGGEAVLSKLAGSGVRLICATSRDDVMYYGLSHDRLAETIVQTVDQDPTDSRLIELRRLVGSASRLFHSAGAEQATALTAEQFGRIRAREGILIRDEARQEWWSACVQRFRQRIADLKGSFASTSAPGAALGMLSELSELGATRQELSELLQERSDLRKLFEDGPAGTWREKRSSAILTVAEAFTTLLPDRLRESFESCVEELGALIWALDFGPMRDENPSAVAKALELREAIVASLRERNPAIPKVVRVDWALIGEGKFEMGSEAQDADQNERPAHTVEVGSFYLCKHPVINTEFAALFGGRWEEEAASRPRYPAVGMTWYQAYVFAAWLGGRLPTEAEWEYAARSGGQDRKYPWGDKKDDICERAVVRGCGHEGPLPVGSKPKGRTDQGVFDMAGNVWEWVTDWYDPYPAEAQKNPWGPVSSSSGNRVIRGGSYVNHVVRARASERLWRFPWLRDDFLGFRVLRRAAPQQSS